MVNKEIKKPPRRARLAYALQILTEKWLLKNTITQGKPKLTNIIENGKPIILVDIEGDIFFNTFSIHEVSNKIPSYMRFNEVKGNFIIKKITDLEIKY